MKRLAVSATCLLITFASLFSQVNKGDSPFYELFRTLSLKEREELVIKEILSGNIPGYQKGFIKIRSVQRDTKGKKHRVIIYVKSDYLTLGSGKSAFIVPVTPKTAQTIADSLNCSLPTPKIVDLIFSRSRLKLDPFNYIPRGERNMDPDIFYDHSRVIFAQIKASGETPGILVSGTKKDVVISSRLSDPLRREHVTIYGWHRPDGTYIQPLYNGHTGNYVDYSHGIRLVSNRVILDGRECDLRDILRDPVLHAILSNEAEPLKIVSYQPLFSTPATWIRVNQVGYLPEDIKIAVLISLEENVSEDFEIVDFITGKTVLRGKGAAANGVVWGMKHALRIDFSALKMEGGYYIVCSNAKSPVFKISASAYEGASDILLEYMRQQRCGDNPYTGEVCHKYDGFIVDHPKRGGERVDVTGGWHDAADYLQYVTTSATAAYQMMFAWEQNKERRIFKDRYDSRGREGANGLPDILDEVKWGMEWLLKMNPEKEVMFNQVADDRDHAGYRLPQDDRVDYGWGPGTGRPAYFVTGEPQGLGKHKNRSTGVASTAGKFASVFRLGAEIFREIDPRLSETMLKKASEAYEFAVKKPGNTQTACVVSPYFYEEDTYADDIELAAATFYNYSKEDSWEKAADYWGELEPVTPWMELGRGRHYQYYPFVNLGHYYLASSPDSTLSMKYMGFMKEGLEHLSRRGSEDPFLFGIPFLWCSNNLVSAALTQARLYRNLSGDSKFLEMETALRDWLFGCNPWGTSMIVGYPGWGDFPDSPHSSYTRLKGDLTTGGLVDGPVENELFRTRAGNALTKEDGYALFNRGKAVYHDDTGDYSSNEPTMDGTAGLTFYFASLEQEGLDYLTRNNLTLEKDDYGAVVRINPERKAIYLIFTADSMFQGGEKILRTLSDRKIKASFFFTGNFLRMKRHKGVIKNIIKEGHYVGAHSDRHILYASWDNRELSYVTDDSLMLDINRNYRELSKFGIERTQSQWFIPPYEWYNGQNVKAAERAGLKVVNYTPGTFTPADYTTPGMKSYTKSDEIINKLFNFERENNLNGALILIHPGVSEEREDKLYDRLNEIIERLTGAGYSFERLN